MVLLFVWKRPIFVDFRIDHDTNQRRVTACPKGVKMYFIPGLKKTNWDVVSKNWCEMLKKI